MKKKYFLMYEMYHEVCYSSKYCDNIFDAEKILKSMVKENNPLVDRLAVGFWEDIPCNDGNLKIFHICSECKRIDK